MSLLRPSVHYGFEYVLSIDQWESTRGYGHVYSGCDLPDLGPELRYHGLRPLQALP